MLCEKCQSREAGIHFAAIHDGRMETHHLCTECASSLVGSFPVSAADFQKCLQILESAFALPSSSRDRPDPDSAAEPAALAEDDSDPDLPDACPVCGLSSADLSLGRRGCPRCYSLIRRSARAFPHDLYRGPVPPGIPPAVAAESQRLRLRARLRDALARRDYETAAEIRRRLQSPPAS